MDSHPTVMLLISCALALATAHPATYRDHVAPVAGGTDTLRVVLVVDDTIARQSLVRGARLGAEEAAHSGALFGMPVTLRIESFASAPGAPATRARHPSLYVVAGDARTCSPILLQSARDDTPVLDAGCAAADSACGRNVFSLVSADVSTAPGDSTRLEAWHWSVERFGGEQLNQRYRRRFGARMDSPAWTGWLAMKIALDAALHAQSVEGASLLRQLADPHAQYDGQKGRPLRFDPATHRLVQPLYRIAGHGDTEHVVAEVAP